MVLPIELADARRQLRMETDDVSRDDDLRSWIADAAAWVETYTGHIFEARHVTLEFDGASSPVLKAWPIKPDAVATVSYAGSDGEPVTFAGRLDVSRRPARVFAAAGTTWPFRSCHQRYTVTVRAGYEEGEPIPGNLKRAMLILITAYDSDREGGELFKAAEKTARTLCQWDRNRAL